MKFQIRVRNKNPLDSFLPQVLDFQIVTFRKAQILPGVQQPHSLHAGKGLPQTLYGIIFETVSHNHNPAADIFLVQQASPAFGCFYVVYIIQNNSANVVHTEFLYPFPSCGLHPNSLPIPSQRTSAVLQERKIPLLFDYSTMDYSKSKPFFKSSLSPRLDNGKAWRPNCVPVISEVCYSGSSANNRLQKNVILRRIERQFHIGEMRRCLGRFGSSQIRLTFHGCVSLRNRDKSKKATGNQLDTMI